MADDLLPPLLNAAEHKKLEALLRLVFKGSGGVEVNVSPDGATVAVAFRGRRGRGGAGDALETIEVALVLDGGSDGDDATLVSYTYTAKDQDGNTMQDPDGNDLTELVPTHNRLQCMTVPATQGTLYFLADGTIELRWTDEIPNYGAC